MQPEQEGIHSKGNTNKAQTLKAGALLSDIII